ncbi:ABC transporter permease [Chloroflexota bacterium]
MLLPLFIANIKMIYRERQALFWALAFPLIFLVIFGLFNFEQGPSAELTIVDLANDEVSRGLVQGLEEIDFFELEVESDEAVARQALADGDVGYVLIIPEGLAQQAMGSEGGATLTLLYDETQIQTNSVVRSALLRSIDQVNLAIQGAHSILGLESQSVTARSVSYFDFLLPGFVGMGVMIYGIIGIASVMALYRQQKILKRIRATPLKVRTFFTAQVLAYLLLSLVQTGIILAAGVFIFGATIYGNVAWAFPLVVLANLTFLNLGFIVGSLSRTVDAANGLGNAVAMPMMFLSGVFFPTDGLPAVLREVVQYLPLTPLLDALRGVMLEAEPVWAFPYELGLLGLWVAVTAVVAVRVFRFE